MTLFNNMTVCDYYQSHAILVSDDAKNLCDDWYFRKGFALSQNVDARYHLGPTVRLSALAVLTGMVPSRKEFLRKIQQRGVFYNDQYLEADQVLDTTRPSVFNDLRLGKRLLEIVVPLGQCLWRDHIFHLTKKLFRVA